MWNVKAKKTYIIIYRYCIDNRVIFYWDNPYSVLITNAISLASKLIQAIVACVLKCSLCIFLIILHSKDENIFIPSDAVLYASRLFCKDVKFVILIWL